MAVEGLSLQRLPVLFGVPVHQPADVVIGQGDELIVVRDAPHDIGETAAHGLNGRLRIRLDQDAGARHRHQRRTCLDVGFDADSEEDHVIGVEDLVLSAGQRQPVGGECVCFLIGGRTIIRS